MTINPVSPQPSVSVVICAYTEDRWDLMLEAVASAWRQTVRPEQVILCVDHNPALYRRAVAHWSADPEGPSQIVENRYPGRLGSSRNTAVELVTGDITAFLDDDAAADPTWLEVLLEAYQTPSIMACGGAPLPVYQSPRPGWIPPEFDWVFGCRYTALPDERAPVRHLIGANMSARTSAIRAVKGFHSDNHDDMDLCHRIHARFGPESVVFEPKAVVHHYVTSPRLTWGYFWRRCYFVNRGKVRAFADLDEAGDLQAELTFARRMAGAVAVRSVRGVMRRDRAALGQAAAIVAGLALAGAGHVTGRAELMLGRSAPSLTTGLP